MPAGPAEPLEHSSVEVLTCLNCLPVRPSLLNRNVTLSYTKGETTCIMHPRSELPVGVKRSKLFDCPDLKDRQTDSGWRAGRQGGLPSSRRATAREQTETIRTKRRGQGQPHSRPQQVGGKGLQRSACVAGAAAPSVPGARHAARRPPPCGRAPYDAASTSTATPAEPRRQLQSLLATTAAQKTAAHRVHQQVQERSEQQVRCKRMGIGGLHLRSQLYGMVRTYGGLRGVKSMHLVNVGGCACVKHKCIFLVVL